MWWFIKSQWWSSFSSQSLSNSFEPKNTFFFHFTSSFFYVIYIYTWNYFIVPQIFTILKYNRWWYATLLHLISSSSFDKISYILWLLKENSRKTFFFFSFIYSKFLGFLFLITNEWTVSLLLPYLPLFHFDPNASILQSTFLQFI